VYPFPRSWCIPGADADAQMSLFSVLDQLRKRDQVKDISQVFT
jgi:hypothetical protein